MDPVAIAARVEGASVALSRRALDEMQSTLPWFGAMPADQRAAIGLIVQGGVLGFARWLLTPEQGLRIGGEVFAAAPGDLARQVSLAQTVELVRLAVGTVEGCVADLAARPDHGALREAMARYSRDIAFAVAMVYAKAAEQRGAWDARLEALVVDGVLAGAVDDSLLSRAAALGWSSPSAVVVIVGTAPEGAPEPVIESLHERGRAVDADVLGGVQAGRLVALVGSGRRLTRVIRALLPSFAAGPVVVGPAVGDLLEAGGSARAAMAGLRACDAWPSAPRPVAADDLLPERFLDGDTDAMARLIATVWRPLRDETALLATVEAYLGSGASIEATAKALWIHPNTVRYRLKRIGDLLGRNISEHRDRYVVELGVGLGRLKDPL